MAISADAHPTVFISYKHNADDADAGMLATWLRHIWGDDQVWLDTRFVGGEAWWLEILRQIERCDALAYLVSRESVESVFCRSELTTAWAKGKTILPITVRPWPLPSALSTAIQHCANLTIRTNPQQFATEVVNVISGVVARNQAVPVWPGSLWARRSSKPNATNNGLVYSVEVPADVEPNNLGHPKCNTGVLTIPGDTLHFRVSGSVSVDSGRSWMQATGMFLSPPNEGQYLQTPDTYQTHGNPPTVPVGHSRVGSLFYWFGDDGPHTSGEYLGDGKIIEVTRETSGFLHLAVNDNMGQFGDNQGSLQVIIEHTHGGV